VSEHGGLWSARVLNTASCAIGDELVVLPDHVRAGDFIKCHGVRQRVTYEHGAYALEKALGGGGMSISDLKVGFLGAAAAGVSSLCCLLPLLVIVLGLGSGAFMMTTMQYRAIFIPAGVIGLGCGWLLYARARKRCSALGCRMAGGTLNLLLLLFATVVVAAAVALDQFPALTADVLTRVMDPASRSMPDQGPMVDHPTMRHGGEVK
jgi:hypothetical protein